MRLLIPLLFLVPLCAQPPQQEGVGGRMPQAPQQEGGRPAGRMPQAPKNLKVLKVGPEGIIPVMRSYTTALGVKCEFCHVRGDFASDDNRKKETARMMIQMAQDINGRFPDGKVHVTCYTCHRGEEEPKTAPAAAAEAH